MNLLNILDKVKNFYVEEIPRETATYAIKVEGSVNNKENMALVNTMASTYSPPKYRLKDLDIRSKELFKFNPISKFYWDIILKKDGIKFYLTTDVYNEEHMINKAKSVWNKCKIAKVNLLEDEVRKSISVEDNTKCVTGEMVLKTYNYKSLSTDMTNQYPLTNMMSIIKALKDEEYVRINICIEPTSRLNWIDIAKEEYEQFDKGKVLNNEIGLKEQMIKIGVNGAEGALDLYLDYKLLLLECVFGIFMTDLELKPNKKEPKTKERKNRFDKYTEDDDIIESMQKNRRKTTSRYKATAEVFKTKITLLSHSNDLNRARINMLAISNAYKDITEENELILKLHTSKETNKTLDELRYYDVRTDKNCILCDRELCKLIQLPQKTLQDEYKMDVIDTRESDVPKQLQNGTIRIGEADEPSKNKKTNVTFPTDTNLLARKLVLIGGENSGKTTQLTRIAKDFYNTGISNFVIDHQENGKLSDAIMKPIPDNKRVVYDVYNAMPPLAFTEIQSLITENMDNILRLDYANMISKQVELFVNSITDDTTGNLTGRMKRFLHSACMITFIKPKTTINDAFTVLSSWKVRNEYLRYAKYSSLFEEEDDVFIDMEELHRRDDKGKIVGTRDDLIAGIVNRVTAIKQNPRIKEMLKKPYDENDNIDKYIQQGKSIFVKIPQNKFPDDDTRDMLAVFYFSRLWLTVQIRKENKDSKLCHCVLDEIKSLPVLASFMEKHITEFRRHRMALTISAHGLAQFGKLLTQLTDSGASFIIMPPCDKKNLEALKEEMKPFTIEECMDLKPHHGLCIINYGNQYWKGICKMYKE